MYQMKDSVSEDQHTVHGLLKSLFHWKADLPLPLSLTNELRRRNDLWYAKKKKKKNHKFDYSNMETHLPDNLFLSFNACTCDKVHSLIFTAS